MVPNGLEDIADGDLDLIDIDSLLDDDTFMSVAFEWACNSPIFTFLYIEGHHHCSFQKVLTSFCLYI